jgi:hypothetical protein
MGPYKAIGLANGQFHAGVFHIGTLASLACLDLADQELWQEFDYSCEY